jgi:hypothetical protein
MVTKLDHWCGFKHSLFIDHKLAVSQRIDIAFDEEQIRTALDG